MSDIGHAPEPSREQVTAAFGADVADSFLEQIRASHKAMTMSDAMTGSVTFIPPDPEIVNIIRLFLEKYELLAEDDKKMYRKLISIFANPPLNYERGDEDMKEKKIIVPEGMLKAAVAAVKIPISGEIVRNQPHDILEAALRWLSENPIVPTTEQIMSEANRTREFEAIMYAQWIGWWQSHMFDAPEPELDPMVMYIMRHFDDVEHDPHTRHNRAQAAVDDYREHLKRNAPIGIDSMLLD